MRAAPGLIFLDGLPPGGGMKLIRSCAVTSWHLGRPKKMENPGLDPDSIRLLEQVSQPSKRCMILASRKGAPSRS